MKTLLYSFIFTIALLLTGCADAGKNQTVDAGALVTLDASASTASRGGEIKRYYWRQVRGKHVTLSDRRAIKPTFTAPVVTKKTALVFRLTTIERGGRPSKLRSRDYVRVNILPKEDNTDEIAPVITLNGSATLTLEVGDTYTEEGATATDNVDGNITTSIIIDGTVDTSTSGEYIITYNVVDTSGNVADEVTRTVTVEELADEVAPIITLIGGNIVLEVGQNYTEEGATAEDNIDGDITQNIVIAGLVDTSTEGNYSVTYNVSDANQNTAEEVIRTVTVILPKDIIPPVISLNGGNIILLVGEIYTELGATATDNRDDVVSVNISSNVNTSSAGSYTVSYTAIDASGNHALPITRTVTVTLPIDTTPPVIILIGGDITLSIGDTYEDEGATALDNIDGDITDNIDTNNTVNTSTVGLYTVSYNVLDDAGNAAVTVTRLVAVEDDVAIPSVNGTITDVAGNALAGVKVYSVSQTTYTNADGYYVLQTKGTAPVSIVVELSNYIQNSQVVDQEVNATQNFTLVYIDKIEVFDAEIGMEIKTKGAKINFPASSVANEDGTAYTGEVTTKVAYNRVTSDIGQAAFPGEYIGETTEGNTTILRSYGFIDVTLEDNASNTLKVADGSSVTLTFPMDDNIDVKPATIPLWYYDTDKGIWVEDGVATYDAVTNSYSGDVTHFTTWNLDAKMNPGSLKGCVEDSDGNPVTTALLNIQGAGWRSGLKQNSGNTFEFLRAPTGMAVSLTAYTTEGISQTATITLAPNENRVMADCLVIETNTTSPIVNVKGRFVNLDGDLITNYASISITNADTGASISSDYTNSGIIDMSILRPDNNKITVTIRISNQTIVQSYVLDPNSNTLNIGDIALDFVQLTAYFVNTDGNTVEIINNASITISSTSGEYITYKSTYNKGATRLASDNFIRPQNNTVNLKFEYDGYVTIFDENVTLTGASTSINLIIPGINIHGSVLDRDGNIFSSNRSILIYDPDNLDQVIGWAKFNNDGTFTSSYFTPPNSGKILIRVSADDAVVDTIVTLTNDTTQEIASIETNFSKITGNLTNYSYGYTNGYTFIKILDTDNNNSNLGYANVTSNGTISSKYINMPDSGNITLLLRKTRFNDVWVRKMYHFDANESLDVGTITLENASVTGLLSYLDGAVMPEGITIRTKNTDYTNDNQYNVRTDATLTLVNGTMNTKDFFRPSNNKIQLTVDLKGKDFTTVVDLDDTQSVTTKDLSIDAITITGVAYYAHDNNTTGSGIGFSSPNIDYLSSIGATDANGAFTLGPIMRPSDTILTLIAQYYKVTGVDKGTSVSILPTVHNTDIGDLILNTSLVRGCVDVPTNGFSAFDVRHNDPFNRRGINGYPTYGNVDISTGTFNMTMWQDDSNTSLYVFATDDEGKRTTKALTFMPNTPLIDYTSPCVVLDNESNTTISVQVFGQNQPLDSTLSVSYAEKRNYYSGSQIFTSLENSGENAFILDMDKNGIYTIKQHNFGNNYGGNVTITIDGIAHTIYIPSTNATFTRSWILFEIEVYQGEVVNIIRVNEIEYPPGE